MSKVNALNVLNDTEKAEIKRVCSQLRIINDNLFWEKGKNTRSSVLYTRARWNSLDCLKIRNGTKSCCPIPSTNPNQA